MAETGQFAHSDILRLREKHETPYSAILREHIVMGVPRYFLERWVPILGPATATVVNTLRQLNYHTPEHPITISGNALAREACMSRRHLYTCLETAWIAAFVRVIPGKRTRTPEGAVIQDRNSYYIRKDDPLTPSDAEHLMQYLRDQADTPIEAAVIALKQRGRDLWAPDIKAAHYFQTPQPISARMVLEHAFPNWRAQTRDEENKFTQLAEDLHHLVTLGRPDGRTSKIIVPQYFRTHWWKELGHDLAWSYLWLRGAIYENPAEGITRHTCWIPSLDVLLRLINRPREWWRRNVDRQPPFNGGGTPADFFRQIAAQKGRDPAHPQLVARQFLVHVDIPIAPDDRELYSILLSSWVEADLNTSPEKIQTSAQPHEVAGEDLHIQSHTTTGPLPYPNTQEAQGSNTSEHNNSVAVAHICAQGCVTSEHRESESIKALYKTSTYTGTKHFKYAKTENAGAATTKTQEKSSENLLTVIRTAFEARSQQPLHRLISPRNWLQQAWPEAISPHAPIWSMAEGTISARDLFALILAVWGDSSVKHPPRYLSWLLQRWKANPDISPVTNWSRWRTLADLPLIDWPDKGYREWSALAKKNRYILPLGLDAVLTPSIEKAEVQHSLRDNPLPLPHNDFSTMYEEDQTSLSVQIGESELTMSDAWQVALSRLSVKLHRAVYTNWVVGSKPIAYKDGKLIVRARHFMAREQLTRRYNRVIEETVSDLTKQPVQICYVL